MPHLHPFNMFSDNTAQKQYYSIQRQSYMKNIILKVNSLLIKYYTALLYPDLSEGYFISILLWKQFREGITIWGAEFMLYLSQAATYQNFFFFLLSLQAQWTWRVQSTVTDPLYLFVPERNQGWPLIHIHLQSMLSVHPHFPHIAEL